MHPFSLFSASKAPQKWLCDAICRKKQLFAGSFGSRSHSFCSFTPGLYTYSNFAKNRLDMAKLSAYPFFVADYTGSVTYPGTYQMWQYSSTGRVPGISGNVDLDHSYVDFLPAIQAGGYNGYEPEIPGLEMVPVPGLKLEVYGTLNCEYFYKPDIYDVAGTLPVGRYEAVAQSVGCYGGFTWVTLRYKNAVYWTALLADRCFLLRA